MNIQDMALVATADFYEMLSKQAGYRNWLEPLLWVGGIGGGLYVMNKLH